MQNNLFLIQWKFAFTAVWIPTFVKISYFLCSTEEVHTDWEPHGSEMTMNDTIFFSDVVSISL